MATSPGETLMPATDTVQQETLIDADPVAVHPEHGGQVACGRQPLAG